MKFDKIKKKNQMKKLTKTKGNVIVEDIRVGDIHYEYAYEMCIKCEVVTKPKRNKHNKWEWKSKDTDGNIIDYLVDPELTHYSANLYDYEAYK